MYVATHDAVSRVVGAAFGKGSRSTPWYLRPEGDLVGMDAAAREAAFEKLAARFGDRRQGDRIGRVRPN